MDENEKLINEWLDKMFEEICLGPFSLIQTEFVILLRPLENIG